MEKKHYRWDVCRRLVFVEAVMLVFSACGRGTDKASESFSESSGQNTAPYRETTPENTVQQPVSSEPVSETPGLGSDESSGEAKSPEEESKALVVYFSATGNTRAAAERLAGLQGADLYEIVPEQPYLAEDLNYNDRDSRATVEQNDPDIRPAISGGITDLDSYGIIYIGYPIWLAYHNLIQCTQA